MGPAARPNGLAIWRSGPAIVVQLNRPEKANAYTASMLQSLSDAIAQAAADPRAQALVITGTGERAFCAGADRDELRNRDWRNVWHLKSAEVFRQLSACRLVTLAAVNGAAVGGGLELALACDLRLASEHARFWLPEPELGLIPAAGGTQRLPEIVGKARAKELILGGAAWDAADALRYGLVSEVTKGSELLSRIDVWVERIARRSPAALELAKRALDLPLHGGAGFDFERLAQALLTQTASPTGSAGNAVLRNEG